MCFDMQCERIALFMRVHCSRLIIEYVPWRGNNLKLTFVADILTFELAPYVLFTIVTDRLGKLAVLIASVRV